ncbi:FlgO family outer membrane protein [Alteromonas sp. CYL-A6]|uniref:FlgO family outer membrane protein n=1 Tax=Alteromonas nitratireducens TaxID=3390813 RepID=UPI0034BCDB60
MVKFRLSFRQGSARRIAACGVLLAGFFTAGCQTSPSASNSVPSDGLPVPALGNVEYHTHRLANELFFSLRPGRQARYAVAGFVPVDTMKYDNSHQQPLMLLGHQLEQGIMTEATKRGFVTQEFKVTNDIIMGEDSDRVLSRDLEQLAGVERVDFFITGTLVYQQAGAMVNARVINARSKEVVAAATRFFPAELFWESEQVTTRQGRIYRTEEKR